MMKTNYSKLLLVFNVCFTKNRHTTFKTVYTTCINGDWITLQSISYTKLVNEYNINVVGCLILLFLVGFRLSAPNTSSYSTGFQTHFGVGVVKTTTCRTGYGSITCTFPGTQSLSPGTPCWVIKRIFQIPTGLNN